MKHKLQIVINTSAVSVINGRNNLNHYFQNADDGAAIGLLLSSGKAGANILDCNQIALNSRVRIHFSFANYRAFLLILFFFFAAGFFNGVDSGDFLRTFGGMISWPSIERLL
mgnify:CR=1 FL=1